MKSEVPHGAVVMASGTVLRLEHSFVTFEGFVFDGMSSIADTIAVDRSPQGVLLKNNAIRNGVVCGVSWR